MTSEVDDIEHILKGNFGNYDKGVNFKWVVAPFLGKGIFASDDSPWKTQRKLASHIFTGNFYHCSSLLTSPDCLSSAEL